MVNNTTAMNGQQYPFDASKHRDSTPMPLCHVHARMEDEGRLMLTYGNRCVACSLNERQELLAVIDTAIPKGHTVDSVSFLRHLIPTDESVERYIRSLTWSAEAGEDEKALVAGNIRGFVTYLRSGGA